MRSLLDFIVRHSYVFLFILLEAISLVLLFGFNDPQREAFATSANGISGTVYEWRTGVGQYFGLKKDNERLAAENAWLREQLYALTDSAKVEYENSVSTGWVLVTRVINNSVRNDDNYITVDRGLADGLRQGMGVYNSDGVVGVVMSAGRHHAIVLPVLNGRTSISCKVKGSHSFGFLEWKGGNPYLAQLRDVPYHADIQEGDTIVTTGFSSVFPENIPVGTVTYVERMKNGYTLRIGVRLAVDMSNLSWVYVHSKTQDPEIDSLMNSIR